MTRREQENLLISFGHCTLCLKSQIKFVSFRYCSRAKRMFSSEYILDFLLIVENRLFTVYYGDEEVF